MGKMTVTEMNMTADIIESKIREYNKEAIDTDKIEKIATERILEKHQSLAIEFLEVLNQMKKLQELKKPLLEKLEKINNSGYYNTHQLSVDSSIKDILKNAISAEVNNVSLEEGMVVIDRKKILQDIMLNQNKEISDIVDTIINNIPVWKKLK